MTKFLIIILSFICIVNFFVPVEASDFILPGRYVRVTKSPHFINGGRETGVLVISSGAKQTAEFHLEVTWNPVLDDDGYRTHNGIIEKGIVIISKNTGRYISSNTEDSELGKCLIDFTFKGNELVLSQKGKCWWFGENVDASGLYRLKPGNEIPIVH